jgi:hypothetical protein
MASVYLSNGVSSTPVSGRFLAHNQLSLVKKAFVGADLTTGRRPLVVPTVLQSAMLARVKPTYVHYALKRQDERAAIEAGLVPLVPPHTKDSIPPVVTIVTGNGHVPPLSNGNGANGHPLSVIEDSSLFDLIASIGVNRVLDTACAVERALHS